jgi:hypothetical protein
MSNNLTISERFDAWTVTFMRFFSSVILDNKLVAAILTTLNRVLGEKKIEIDITLNDDI